MTNSSLEKNAVYNGSYIGFIQSYTTHSVVSDIRSKGVVFLTMRTNRFFCGNGVRSFYK